MTYERLVSSADDVTITQFAMRHTSTVAVSERQRCLLTAVMLFVNSDVDAVDEQAAAEHIALDLQVCFRLEK